MIIRKTINTYSADHSSQLFDPGPLWCTNQAVYPENQHIDIQEQI